MIGASPAMEQLRLQLRQVAEADVDTLIEGESRDADRPRMTSAIFAMNWSRLTSMRF
jgi:hypothetical protein